MTTDERIDAIARALDTLTKIHLGDDREYRERFQQIAAIQEKNSRDIQDLTREMQSVRSALQLDAENIRALARVAELHEQRLDRLEDQ